MQTRVLRWRHDRKVLDTIVRLVTVDVMDNFGRFKIPSKMGFHNQTVLHYVSLAVHTWVIRRVHPVVSIVAQYARVSNTTLLVFLRTRCRTEAMLTLPEIVPCSQKRRAAFRASQYDASALCGSDSTGYRAVVTTILSDLRWSSVELGSALIARNGVLGTLSGHRSLQSADVVPRAVQSAPWLLHAAIIPYLWLVDAESGRA